MEHAMAKIERTKSAPMTKQPAPTEAPDDRTKGKLFAQECIALVIGQASPWLDLTRRAFDMTVEARKVAVDQLDRWIKAKRDELAQIHDTEDKVARKRLNSATVQLSKMRTCIKAMNGGMTRDTCAEYWKNTFDNLGFDAVVEVARTFSDSKAGRKPDSLLVKLGKWIEVQKKGVETAEDRALMDELLKFYNTKAD